VIESRKGMNDDSEKIRETRRELIAKMEFLLGKGYEQACQLDKSLLALSSGAWQ